MNIKTPKNFQKESRKKLFSVQNQVASQLHVITNRYYETLTTVVEFIAAVLFLVGSILFFHEEYKTTGTWLFLWGSIFFIIRPSLKLAKEIHLIWIYKRKKREPETNAPGSPHQTS